MNYPIAIRAYNRTEIPTLKLFENHKKDITIFIENEELRKKHLKKYEKEYSIVITNTKGVSRKTNFIWDYYGNGTEIIMCDDDVKAYVKKDGEKIKTIKEQDFFNLANKGFELIKKYKTILWGFYPVPDGFFMDNSISFCSFIIFQTIGIKIDREIREDDEFMLKDDHNILGKVINKYSRIIRFNNFGIKAGYGTAGGLSDIRSENREKQECQGLIKKYPYLFYYNPKRKNQLLVRNIWKNVPL